METPLDSDTLIVFGESVPLYQEPDVTSPIRSELPYKSELKRLSKRIYLSESRDKQSLDDQQDKFWLYVGYQGQSGWVTDNEVLPEPAFKLFQPAHECARANDTVGMKRELDKFTTSKGSKEWQYDISPDGSRALVIGDCDYDYWGIYPGGGRIGGFPILFLQTDKGIVTCYRSDWLFKGFWSANSHYYVYSLETMAEYPQPYIESLNVMNMDSMTSRQLTPNLRHTWWKEDTVSPFEVVGNLAVFLDFFPLVGYTPKGLEHDCYKPILKAYDMDTGKFYQVMAADLSTLELDYKEKFGMKFYQVDMLDTVNYPELVTTSRLYQYYRYHPAILEDLTHFME